MAIRNILNNSFYYFLLTLLLCACNNEIEMETSIGKELTTTEDISTIESLGFNISDIIDMGSYYLVEGDIVFEKCDLPFYKSHTRQARWSELISYPNQKTITVGVANSIPTTGADNWRSEIQQAINLWNPLSNIKMTYTTDTNPDILIYSDTSLENYVIAAASWPLNGKPGSSIRINLTYNNNKLIPSSQKVYNMVHELGHCLGLRHTNWKERNEPTAIHISGTPVKDNNSVMNGGTAEYSWSGFSDNDKYAIKNLYPFFQAYLTGFPKYLPIGGLGLSTIIGVSCTHPIVSYSWNVSGGTISGSRESSTINAYPGSPVTFGATVQITTIYGEKYRVSQMVAEDSKCTPIS